MKAETKKSSFPVSRRQLLVGATTGALGLSQKGRSSDDVYARYVKTSKDFAPVKQDKVWLQKAFPGWLYMPWTYQWSIGYTDESGKWSRSHGYNGAFLDGNGGSPDTPAGKLKWIERNHLHFYLDHTAGKGDLHLWDGGKEKEHLTELHSGGMRTVPLNSDLKQKLFARMKANIEQVKLSPLRSAYALDDEISWGHFVHPAMWRVTDEPLAYTKWLKEVYGEQAPPRSSWVSYDELRPKLADWSIKEFDASPLMDQWSFNDSYWCNFLGELVEYANKIDPQTPCGFVGGQSPSPFGGYDYAKLMRKIQFIEAYDVGSSQAIIRSFNPHNAIPAVTSHFHQSPEDDLWQVWRYLAHGNRGHIGWVENWFDGKTPKPWHARISASLLEASEKIGPLMQDAEWLHDGVALYYSHASIQLGWILDAEAHGKTWVNRNGDHRLGASHHVRHAWENMLRDSGIQYNWLSYVDVIQKGVPSEYRVLILPSTLCLSDAEAKEIEAFCRRGGTVIADYLPGVWDQHGKGRAAGGALDTMFGVRHDPEMRAGDVFGKRLWCEVDQDANFSWKTYKEFLTNGNDCLKEENGFHRCVRKRDVSNSRKFGLGTAALLNLSPQWYNACREEGFQAAKKRVVFLKYLFEAGVRRWVEIEGASEKEFGYEITYFRKADGGRVLFCCSNPEISGSETGGGNAVGLKTEIVEISLKFAKPVKNVRDERSGKSLGSGDRFKLKWVQNEAIVLSYD